MPGHISFTAVAIARRVIDALGTLDERYVGYGYEDNDYCHRAIAAGETIAVYDGCVVGHWKPHTTFSRTVDFAGQWQHNETLFWEKWGKRQDVVVVVGGSRSGAAVVSAIVDAMGYDMPDKPAPFEKRVSQYYRDDRLSRKFKGGAAGLRNYVAGRDIGGKPWGTRIWPNVEGGKALVEALGARRVRVIVVERGLEARIRSQAMSQAVRYDEAKNRVEAEEKGHVALVRWLDDVGYNPLTIFFDELIIDPDGVVADIALYLGREQSVAVARSRVYPELATFDGDGDLLTHDAPADFGRVAVGVRLTHPDPGFVGCWGRLLRQGLRPDDVLLEPAIRTPSHWAASLLMRRFLSSGCDTLLLVDDDMTFPDDLLERMRSKADNWRYDIVSALATQRVPPPRAIVLRRGEQPGLPDGLNGIYYNMLTNEVVNGETMPVDACGFAFTLIRRSIIERMTDPTWGPGHTAYVTWGEGGEGEDVNFCRRAGSLGASVAVDGAAHVGHVGAVVYGYDEFDRWRGGGGQQMVPAEALVRLVGEAAPHLNGASLATALTLLRGANESDE
jgi:GT2 family glycosyltransferase